MQAIDNVMHVRQVRQYYKDLEHMVRYELGMPDLWAEIKEEQNRLINEAKELERLQRLAQEQAELKRQEKINRIKQKIHIYVAIFIANIYVYSSVWFLTWLVEYDREWRWGY
jgi:site-specific DNA-adenine methylase